LLIEERGRIKKVQKGSQGKERRMEEGGDQKQNGKER